MPKWHCTRCEVDWEGEPRCWSCESDKNLEPEKPPVGGTVYGFFGMMGPSPS